MTAKETTNTSAEQADDTALEQVNESETTKVKVVFTNIKYFNEDSNTVGELKIIGKKTMIEAKKLVKDLEGKNVLISKDNIKEEFSVNTVALYALKDSE